VSFCKVQICLDLAFAENTLFNKTPKKESEKKKRVCSDHGKSGNQEKVTDLNFLEYIVENKKIWLRVFLKKKRIKTCFQFALLV